MKIIVDEVGEIIAKATNDYPNRRPPSPRGGGQPR
jgi:hypothetical protein